MNLVTVTAFAELDDALVESANAGETANFRRDDFDVSEAIADAWESGSFSLPWEYYDESGDDERLEFYFSGPGIEARLIVVGVR